MSFPGEAFIVFSGVAQRTGNEQGKFPENLCFSRGDEGKIFGDSVNSISNQQIKCREIIFPFGVQLDSGLDPVKVWSRSDQGLVRAGVNEIPFL